MTTKKANWLFLTIILTHIGVVLFLYFGRNRISISIVINGLLSEAILMIPTVLFLFACARKARRTQPTGESREAQAPARDAVRSFEAAAFHKVKISTLLMIALCTFLMMPLVAVLNALSMLFAENVMASLQSDILGASFPIMLLMIGIAAPFCEEFVFRGVIYRSYGRSVPAILLSAFLFGLMHMNFNQMIYAFAMGIFLALLVEAAGSLWASIFCHIFFNSMEVVLMYGSRQLLGSAYEQAVVQASAELTTQSLLAALSFYLILAAITTPIAGCIVVWIAKNEGRQQAVAALFSKRKQPNVPQPQHLLSVPLIVAIVLCLGFVSLEFFW